MGAQRMAREGRAALVARFGGEFREMPGLRLTLPQAARLFGVQADVAFDVLDELRRASVVARASDGRYALATEDANREGDALREASIDRLACLMRHWTWTDEARQRFERELTDGWEYENAPFADHPFGAYYHWCALLCSFGDAALEDGLLSSSAMGPIRADLEASQPALRACRQLLLTIPSTLEQQPLVADLIRSEESLGRLRRLHVAFGDALNHARASREVESLDQ